MGRVARDDYVKHLKDEVKQAPERGLDADVIRLEIEEAEQRRGRLRVPSGFSSWEELQAKVVEMGQWQAGEPRLSIRATQPKGHTMTHDKADREARQKEHEQIVKAIRAKALEGDGLALIAFAILDGCGDIARAIEAHD